MKGLYSVDYFPEEWQGPDCEIELYEDEAELALMNFLKFIQEEDGYAPFLRQACMNSRCSEQHLMLMSIAWGCMLQVSFSYRTLLQVC